MDFRDLLHWKFKRHSAQRLAFGDELFFPHHLVAFLDSKRERLSCWNLFLQNDIATHTIFEKHGIRHDCFQHCEVAWRHLTAKAQRINAHIPTGENASSFNWSVARIVLSVSEKNHSAFFDGIAVFIFRKLQPARQIGDNAFGLRQSSRHFRMGAWLPERFHVSVFEQHNLHIMLLRERCENLLLGLPSHEVGLCALPAWHRIKFRERCFQGRQRRVGIYLLLENICHIARPAAGGLTQFPEFRCGARAIIHCFECACSYFLSGLYEFCAEAVDDLLVLGGIGEKVVRLGDSRRKLRGYPLPRSFIRCINCAHIER